MLKLNKPGEVLSFPFPGVSDVTVNMTAPTAGNGAEIVRLIVEIELAPGKCHQFMPALLGLCLHSIRGVEGATDGLWMPDRDERGALTQASWEAVIPFYSQLALLARRLVSYSPRDAKN